MAFHWIGKSSDGETVTLKRLGTHLFQFPDYFNSEWESQNAGQVLIGSTIDVETSGLSPAKDKIIELGIRQFKYHRTTGEVLALTREYSSFQDPGEPISDEVSLLTGITNEMIQGKNIDWNEADSLLKESSLIIAHNAAFDRSVMMVTALSPVIGYDQASVIAHYAIDKDLTLKEAALANGVTEALYDQVVVPINMTQPGSADIKAPASK